MAGFGTTKLSPKARKQKKTSCAVDIALDQHVVRLDMLSTMFNNPW